MNNAGAVGDLLEVPKLLDACVRNGHYDEALDLENFVAKMETTHGDIGLIRKLAEEARASSAEMLHALLGRLRVKIQLPECLRTVGYLRRLSAYDETTLRRTFLSCREEYIARCVAELDDSNPYDYLKKLTDTHRVALFDLVMQYRAIFSDDTEGEASREGSALLYSWATHRISKYVELVEATLPRVFEGGALASVYEHCEYCGTSLARVGLDTRRSCDRVRRRRRRRPRRRARVRRRRFRARARGLDVVVVCDPIHAERIDGRRPDAPPASSPSTRRSPLVNGVLLAHNELRHTPVLDLRGPPTTSMESTLARATAALHAAHTAPTPSAPPTLGVTSPDAPRPALTSLSHSSPEPSPGSSAIPLTFVSPPRTSRETPSPTSRRARESSSRSNRRRVTLCSHRSHPPLTRPRARCVARRASPTRSRSHRRSCSHRSRAPSGRRASSTTRETTGTIRAQLWAAARPGRDAREFRRAGIARGGGGWG